MLLNCVNYVIKHHDFQTRQNRQKTLMRWKLKWLHAKLKNRLNNAASTTSTRELTFSLKWKMKNWIIFVIIIAIDANHNDVYENNEMKQNENCNIFDDDLKLIVFLIK